MAPSSVTFSCIFSFRITTSHNYKWCTVGMKKCGAIKVFPFVGQVRPISPSKIITQVNNPGYFTKNNDDMRRIPVCRTMLPKISTKIWTWYYSRKIYNFWSAFRWSISITSNHPKLKFKSVTNFFRKTSMVQNAAKYCLNDQEMEKNIFKD